MQTFDFSTLNTDDIIDVRDIIERIEELERERESLRKEFDAMLENNGVDFDHWVCNQSRFTREDQTELDTLMTIMEELKGCGGNEQWCGDGYPMILIRESYFVDYCQELLEDCGEISRDLLHYIAIDWEATARNIMIDYSTVEIDGVTYLYR